MMDADTSDIKAIADANLSAVILELQATLLAQRFGSVSASIFRLTFHKPTNVDGLKRVEKIFDVLCTIERRYRLRRKKLKLLLDSIQQLIKFRR